MSSFFYYYSGIAFPIQCKAILPIETLVVKTLSVRYVHNKNCITIPVQETQECCHNVSYGISQYCILTIPTTFLHQCRGALGPLTVWVTKPIVDESPGDALQAQRANPTRQRNSVRYNLRERGNGSTVKRGQIVMKDKYWDKIYERTHR